MKPFLVPLVLLTLAACAQVPVPHINAPSNLSPLTFGSSGDDEARGLAKHSSGVYAVGYTSGNLHSTQLGNGDAFIRKYDTNGGVLWGKQFGTPLYETAEGVASDSSNNAYVVGTTFGSLAGSRGNNDVFLRKYTSSGSVSWTRQFGTSAADYVGDVAVSGSNVYVVGFTEGDLSGSSGSWDAFVRKYNSSGGVVWTRQFGTSSEDFAEDVALDSSGNVYVAGSTYGSVAGINGGGEDIFLRKYSASGNVVWTKQRHFGDLDTGNAVAVSGSTVYLVGNVYNGDDRNIRVLKFTTSGSPAWNKSYGPVGYDYAFDASADSGGNLYLAGQTSTNLAGTNQGGADGYVIKLNTSGSYVWKKQLGTSEYDATLAVLARTSSEIYAAGQTYGMLGSANSGSSDAYLRRVSATNGNTIWTDQ